MYSIGGGMGTVQQTAWISSDWLRDYIREHGGIMTVTFGLVVD
jgi:hypothetical protein